MAKRVILDPNDIQEASASTAQKVAARWDRAMRRAFKGIQPRPTMRAALLRSPLNRVNQKDDDADAS